MQACLRGLEAVPSYGGPGRPEREDSTAVHPVVRRHPVTGAEGIYLNRMFVTRFAGWTPAKSRPLVDLLDWHLTCPEFTCRVRWQEGHGVSNESARIRRGVERFVLTQINKCRREARMLLIRRRLETFGRLARFMQAVRS